MAASNGYQLVSADAHVLEPPDLFERRVPSELRAKVPRLETRDGASVWVLEGLEPVPLPPTVATGSGFRLGLSADGGPVTFDDALPGLYDPAERLKMQDADSVDAEVLYPSPGLWDAVNLVEDRAVKLACARAYNDWLAEFCSHRPDRLVGLAKLPTTTCADAREELLRAVHELGLRGVILDAWPSGGAGGDPAADPFWEAAQETGAPVSLHYAIGAGQKTVPPSGIAPGMKPPMADAALPLVVAGVFDRFPNVRLVFAHGDAGWALHWLEFMDINYVRHRHLDEYRLQDQEAVPSEYIRRHTFFTVHCDRSAVKNRDKLGTAHLMWASHFPLDDANWPDDREQAMRVTEELPADDGHAIRANNAARLYRLPGSEDFGEDELRSFGQLVHF